MKKRRLVLIYVLSVVAAGSFLFYKLSAPKPAPSILSVARSARLTMVQALAVLRDCRQEKGVPIDTTADPNRTGLIGLEHSAITTSLGNLEAKRTTANPEFAALLVRLLDEAGAKEGEAVAIGASSSFPGLIIAALCACKAMDVTPLLISSLGASNWGANDPAFHWLDMQDCLNASGVLNVESIAVSMGGDEDRGRDMTLEGRALLTEAARARGIPLLEESSLAENVQDRLRLYEQRAAGRPIRAFINIGGSWVNLGTDSRILNVKPGLSLKGGSSEITDFPPVEKSGMIFAMARRGVPVIHLLYIHGLCRRYGLPWDPRASTALIGQAP